jgi:putative ABC transport system permease protein
MKEFFRAFRSLSRRPAFAALCIAPLAVGIGASTAIFSLVEGIVLNPLPYRHAGRLVGIWHIAPALTKDEVYVSVPLYLLYASRGRDLEAIALYREGRVNLSGGAVPERVRAATVTASLFRTLEVRPALGRSLDATDEKPGAPRAVVLSDRLWHRRFGADPAVLGRPVRIDGQLRTVAGVMGPDFHFPHPETDLWLPRTLDPGQDSLGDLNDRGIARLRPGVAVAAAQADLNALLSPLDQAFPGEGAARVLARSGFACRLHPLREDVVGKTATTLWLLLGAVGFILLIACANVSSLLVVRGEARQRETAIRIALGAFRRHLVSSALGEGLLFGLAACAVGLLLAWLGTRSLVRLAPANLPRLDEVAIDGRVLAFSLVLALLVSLVVGLIPARRLGRISVERALREGGQAASASGGKRGLQRLLVAVQVALALTVLTGAGLMALSYQRLSQVTLGFDPRQLLVVQLSLPAADYPHDTAVARFIDRLIGRLAAVPGVEAAAAISNPPLGGSVSASGQVIEGLALEAGAPPPFIETCFITPGYFKAMHIPLRSGRDLMTSEVEARRGVAVVDEALAKRYWPQGAVGRRIHPGGEAAGVDAWYTIVGVVGSVRTRQAGEHPHGTIYYPLLGKRPDGWTPHDMAIVLRAAVAPTSLQQVIRREITAADPNLPIASSSDMQQLVRRDRAPAAFAAVMMLLALAVTLVLAGIGVYGFTSYAVSQRTQELGIRIAIGAQVGHILRTILGESATMALAGIGAGLVTSLLLTRAMAFLLYEVSPLDPLTFAAAPILILSLVLAASYLPAIHAAHVEPLRALGMVSGAAAKPPSAPES